MNHFGASYDLEWLQKCENGPLSLLYRKMGYFDISSSIPDAIVSSDEIAYFKREMAHLKGEMGHSKWEMAYSEIKNGLFGWKISTYLSLTASGLTLTQ